MFVISVRQMKSNTRNCTTPNCWTWNISSTAYVNHTHSSRCLARLVSFYLNVLSDVSNSNEILHDAFECVKWQKCRAPDLPHDTHLNMKWIVAAPFKLTSYRNNVSQFWYVFEVWFHQKCSREGKTHTSYHLDRLSRVRSTFLSNNFYL